METVGLTRNSPAVAAEGPIETATAAGSQPSAVAWGAIFAGAVGAAATSIILLGLATGLGLTVVSPWNGEGVSAKALTVGAVIAMVVVQWLSAALGGYLTGRLRTRWTLHDDEVYFRDTAHGFLAWALSIVVIALLATSMMTSVLGGTARGAAAGASQATAQSDTGPVAAAVDTLYRSDNPGTASSDDVRGETVRLMTRSLS